MIEKAKDMPVFIIIILGVLCAEFLWLYLTEPIYFFRTDTDLLSVGGKIEKRY